MEDVKGLGHSTARPVLAWAAAAGYAALIFYFSSRSGDGLPNFSFLGFDKVLHTGEYFWFGVLLATALRASGLGFRAACVVAVAIAIAYGVSDEYHQTFVPGRQGNDLGDITADAFGATLGVCALALVRFGRARRLQGKEAT